MFTSRVTRTHNAAPFETVGATDDVADDVEVPFADHVRRRTPVEATVRLRREIAAILTEPDTVARLREQGGTPGTADAEAFLAQIAAESQRWRDVIQRAGIRVEG